MEPVSVIKGSMAPLPRANVDTDQIIPKQFLKRVERSGFGPFLFHDWAHDAEGERDPAFELNHPQRTNAVVLVTGPNFGSGSSREHAPWAIEDRGFRAIIAPSFADIFRTNCAKIGLLAVVLEPAEVEQLMDLAAITGNEVTIDLEAQTVVTTGFNATFEIDPFVKHSLLNGLDEIALTLAHADHISTFEADRPTHKPSVT
ncbi:MAG: 3-isopropylmalate dehydratase small subunit [Actinomycetota bacterium]|nr:3-isopropylmalate dehydratase small subunit [Actinomycetota bacterium]